MSVSSTLATIPVAHPPLKPDWLRPGAHARLHDPAPAWVSGLSDDFRERRYGKRFADIAREKLS
jgi:hypothetical protein